MIYQDYIGGGGGWSVGGQTDTGRLTIIDPRDNRQSERERDRERERERGGGGGGIQLA